MGSRVDIFFPNKGEFIHTIIDRSNIRIGGAGSSSGAVCAPVVFSVNSTEVKTVQSGSPYNLDIINSALQSVGIFADDKLTVQDGQVVVKDSAGNTLYTVNVASNGAVNRPVGDSVVEIRDTAGAVLYIVSVLAEGSDFRVVGNSTVNVRRSDNTLIEAKTVKAQGTENAVVGDSTVNVLKSDGVLIAAVPVKAQATVPYDVANSTVTMKDSAGATLDSKSVKATESAEFTAPNATAPIKDSAGVLLKTEVFKSGETRDVGIGDSVLTLNGDAFLNVKSQASQNIQLLSSVDDSDIVPASVVGAVIKVDPGGATMDVDFTANKLTALIAENITFTDLTDNSPTHWSWFFSDGTTAIAQNPVKNFLSLGQKNITLLAGKVGAGGVKIKNSFIEIIGDADAGAFLGAAAITDPTIVAAINVLVTDLKNAGLWAKMKAIYPIVGGSAAAHRFNLKNPLDTNAAFRMTFSGGWTHSANGMLGNGSNTFANTFLSPLAELNPNSTHLSYYSRTVGLLSSNHVEMGSQEQPNIRNTYIVISYGGLIYPNLNSQESSGGDTPYTNRQGHKTFSRVDASNVKAYNNSSLLATYARTANTLNNFPIYIGAYNQAGTSNWSSNAEFAFASIGDGLTDAEVATYNTIVQTFQTTLGRQV